MILPDHQIRLWIERGDIVVRPLAEGAIQPASVDLRLGPVLRIAESHGHRVHDLQEHGPLYFDRGMFVLAHTLEWIEVPDNMAGILAGKSTRARQGIVLESAGYVDPGWRGELTLELFNLSPSPVRLVHGMTIGQIRFEYLIATCDRPYGAERGNHYQDSHGPIAARIEVPA